MIRILLVTAMLVQFSPLLVAQEAATKAEQHRKTKLPPLPKLGPYVYEIKPEGEEYEKINPRKSPPFPESTLLRKGDRLVIIGDSITEQKLYSRFIETYLTVCYPQLEIETRQLGWGGETAARFLQRIDQDCLRFDPTIATLSYGMNDARYRPFDFNTGVWYSDHYTAIVERLQQSGARVVVGSPGCAGKIAKWVKSKSGTLDEHNQALCTLRDIAMQISFNRKVGFADVYWPMYQAQVKYDAKYSTDEKPYRVAGQDGIHPSWAGHSLMAYAYLRALGLDGNLAQIQVNYKAGLIQLSEGHAKIDSGEHWWEIESDRYPFCAAGKIDDENSVRSGMTLVPFNEKLNRWILVVSELDTPRAIIRWGNKEKTFTADQLKAGVNLADEFVSNPFSAAFGLVDKAVAAKQKYETVQIKQVFHGERGKADIERAVIETEAVRQGFVDEIKTARKAVRHRIHIKPVR